MGSKRNSTGAAPNIEFLRSDNAGKEDKCKEFWKYLDEKKSLQPYQPPKASVAAKQCAARASTGTTSKPSPTYPCGSKGTKPKKPPVKKEKRRLSAEYHSYEKIFREGLEFATYDPTPDELLAEIDEYDRKMNALNPPICPICEKTETDCNCSDTE